MTPCRGGCGQLVKDPGTCTACRTRQDKARPSAQQRGYTTEWARTSKGFLRANPLCVGYDGKDAHAHGCKRAAEVTDHRIPHKGDMALFWDAANWQPMSKRCHDYKTAKEDGSFGRPCKQANNTRSNA